MTRILLVGTSPDFVHAAQAALGALHAVEGRPFPSSPTQLFAMAGGIPQPEVVLLEPGDDTEAALALADGLTHGYRVPVILVTEAGAEIGLEALRAGVSDVVAPDATAAELAASLDRALAHAQPSGIAAPVAVAPHTGPRGQIIAIASPKGGVGKTTVSTNLAVGLARRSEQSTVLVDLDIHFGDVASALNLTPEYSLPDVTQGPALHDSMALKSLLTRHETGLFVIPGSDSPAAADAVSPASVGVLLESLAEQFQYVVVDTAPGLSEHTLAVLDVTDSLVMVTSLDVPGVRGLRKELDTLTDLGIAMGVRSVVLNFFEPSRGLTVADVEATIRSKVDVVLPVSRSVPISVNQGIPLLQGEARDPAAKGLLQLVERLAPHAEGAKPRGFLFGRRAKSESAR